MELQEIISKVCVHNVNSIVLPWPKMITYREWKEYPKLAQSRSLDDVILSWLKRAIHSPPKNVRLYSKSYKIQVHET